MRPTTNYEVASSVAMQSLFARRILTDRSCFTSADGKDIKECMAVMLSALAEGGGPKMGGRKKTMIVVRGAYLDLVPVQR